MCAALFAGPRCSSNHTPQPHPSPSLWHAVNNVGTNIRKPSTQFSASDYSTIFTTNLESAFTLSQLFHPLLKAAGSSVLMFNSSVAGAGVLSGCGWVGEGREGGV